MRIGNMQPLLAVALVLTVALVGAATAVAAPVTYQIDPSHTYPSFEADHMGISVWRGKMTKNSGTVEYDKATGTGTVEIAIDPAGIDFGQKQLNAWALGKDFFDVEKHPKASYKGRFEGATNGGVPTQIVGELTLRGVTRPMTLKINALKCVPHPMLKRELCGADASGSFNREAFGLDAGKAYGFKMDVDLRIQVEAVAAS
jgi:polyisoprenoid-binding protein YceI